MRLDQKDLYIARATAQANSIPLVQKALLGMIHNKQTVDILMKLFHEVGNVETYPQLKQKLLNLSPGTVSVLQKQLTEVLYTELKEWPSVNTPCYFGMSINDPLLDYDKTLQFIKSHFPNMKNVEFNFPFHQPPHGFTLKYLNKEFKELLRIIK